MWTGKQTHDWPSGMLRFGQFHIKFTIKNNYAKVNVFKSLFGSLLCEINALLFFVELHFFSIFLFEIICDSFGEN